MKTTRVVIAEDHLVVRENLKALLATEPGLEVAAEAGDGLEALRLVQTLRPELLVTDLGMPGLHGLELVRMTRSQSPGTRVVVVSVHVEEAYVRAAIQNGALAFVAKSQSSECLVPAVRRALAGEKYISPPLPESLAN